MTAGGDLPALLVVVPVAGAAAATAAGVAVPERHRSVAGWTVAVLALAVQVGLALLAARAVVGGGPVRYAVAGFPPPVGVELVVDRLAVPFIVLVAGVVLWALAATGRAGARSPAVAALYLLLVAGLTGVCVTGDAFTLYVFLEISGLAAYALVAAGDGAAAAAAALRYLLVGTVGATLYLLGVAYAYVATGTLNVADLAAQLPAAGFDSRLVVASYGLVAVGLAVKVALFPVHGWKPPAYATAPPAATAVLAALVSTVATYALLRLTYSAYAAGFLAANPAVRPTLLALASASVVAGSVLALRQADVRRMLAYSGVSQFGVAVAGLAAGTPAGLAGAVVQLVGHAVMKAGAFLVAGVVAAAEGTTTVDGYAGLADRRPVTSAALGVLALGLVGVPPAVGFFGKWFVALGALRAGAWPVAGLVVASTLLALPYFARLLQRVYVESPPGDHSVDGDDAVPRGMVAAAVVAALLAVALGLAATELRAFVAPAVERVVP